MNIEFGYDIVPSIFTCAIMVHTVDDNEEVTLLGRVILELPDEYGVGKDKVFDPLPRNNCVIIVYIDLFSNIPDTMKDTVIAELNRLSDIILEDPSELFDHVDAHRIATKPISIDEE